jgi:hypothetical protein
MIIGYARVWTREQNLGLRHDDPKLAFDASVDQTGAILRRSWFAHHDVMLRGILRSILGSTRPRSPGKTEEVK